MISVTLDLILVVVGIALAAVGIWLIPKGASGRLDLWPAERRGRLASVLVVVGLCALGFGGTDLQAHW